MTAQVWFDGLGASVVTEMMYYRVLEVCIPVQLALRSAVAGSGSGSGCVTVSSAGSCPRLSAERASSSRSGGGGGTQGGLSTLGGSYAAVLFCCSAE